MMTKPPLGKVFIFKEALEELARVIEVGEDKHGSMTWVELFEESPEKCIDSITRHLAAYASGEFRDQEDGFAHMAAIAFRSLALCTIGLRQEMVDDAQIAQQTDIPSDSLLQAGRGARNNFARQGWDGYPS